jgi:putative membrane protein insertion efficiency factor
MRKALVFLIALYQKTLSPDHGIVSVWYPYGFCRHHPTCSEYGKDVITKKGTLKGGMLLMKRLFSCHPWKELSEEKMRTLI